MGLFCILSSLLLCSALGDLVVNEVYYDHPGADSGYEFVEFYNPLPWPVSLYGVTLEFHNGSGDGWTVLWSGSAADSVAPGGVFTIGAPEVRPVPEVVLGLSLQNGPDAVALFREGIALDVVGYGGLDDPRYVETVGVDRVPAGRSIARIPDGRDSGDNAADFSAAAPTPTRTNVARHDAALALPAATPARSVTEPGAVALAVELRNGGTEPIAPATVTIVATDSSAGGVRRSGPWRNRGVVSAGRSELVDISLTLTPGYHHIAVAAQYDADERDHNDAVALLRRAGTPALIISEVLSSPADGCPQFVEIYNAGNTDVPLDGYGVRDRSHDPVPFGGDATALAPRGFAVVTPDAASLGACFDLHGTAVYGVDATWPVINRTGGEVADSVVIVDALELPVDRVAVPGIPTAAKGRSLERVELFGGAGVTWVLSSDPRGATPGTAGPRTLYVPPPPGEVSVRPNPYFPAEGLLTVAIDAAHGARVVTSVFDTLGRRIATLGVAGAFPAVEVWNGRDETGAEALPGLYIIACEISTGTGTRVVRVVIACGRR